MNYCNLLVFLFLSALSVANAQPLPQSKFYNVGIGATFTFRKSIPMELELPYKAFLFFQNGKAVAQTELIKGEPYCYFWAVIFSSGHREIRKGDALKVKKITLTDSINMPGPFFILDFDDGPAHWSDGTVNSLWCFDSSVKEEASYQEMLRVFGRNISVSFPN